MSRHSENKKGRERETQQQAKYKSEWEREKMKEVKKQKKNRKRRFKSRREVREGNSAGSKPNSSLDVGISYHLLTLTAWCSGGGFSSGQMHTNTQEILD